MEKRSDQRFRFVGEAFSSVGERISLLKWIQICFTTSLAMGSDTPLRLGSDGGGTITSLSGACSAVR
jgi:hypothetical protein